MFSKYPLKHTLAVTGLLCQYKQYIQVNFEFLLILGFERRLVVGMRLSALNCIPDYCGSCEGPFERQQITIRCSKDAKL